MTHPPFKARTQELTNTRIAKDDVRRVREIESVANATAQKKKESVVYMKREKPRASAILCVNIKSLPWKLCD